MMSWMRHDLAGEPMARSYAITHPTGTIVPCAGHGLGARRVRHRRRVVRRRRGQPADRATSPGRPAPGRLGRAAGGRRSDQPAQPLRPVPPVRAVRAAAGRGRAAAGPRAPAGSRPPGATAPSSGDRSTVAGDPPRRAGPTCPTCRCRCRSPTTAPRPRWPPPCWPTRRRRRRWTSWPVATVSSRRTLERRFRDETGDVPRPAGGPASASSRPCGCSPAGATTAQTAPAVGFATPSAFAHAFRRELGTTPSQFVRVLSVTATPTTGAQGLDVETLRARDGTRPDGRHSAAAVTPFGDFWPMKPNR